MINLDTEKLNKTIESIEQTIQQNKIVLYMKGNREEPRCGFSNLAVEILNFYKADYQTIDVLQDMYVREGVKKFSDWPTVPQLYANGKFVGGSDIIKELHENKEFESLIK